MAGLVHIALLRAVMPTGKNKVPMAALRALLAALGFQDTRTLLASGNAVFRSTGLGGPELEALLETEIARRIGPKLHVMVRDADAFARILASNPFPQESAEMPSRVQAVLFKRAVPEAAARAIEAAVTGPEQARIMNDVAWITYPNGIAQSALTSAFFKRHLGDLPGTARNWNTMQKLKSLADEIA